MKVSIQLFGKEAQEEEVLIDSTVQEKDITYPTDAKLHKRIIERVNKIAKQEGIPLRQTYTRSLKQLMIDQRFHNHPKEKKEGQSRNAQNKNHSRAASSGILKESLHLHSNRNIRSCSSFSIRY